MRYLRWKEEEPKFIHTLQIHIHIQMLQKYIIVNNWGKSFFTKFSDSWDICYTGKALLFSPNLLEKRHARPWKACMFLLD